MANSSISKKSDRESEEFRQEISIIDRHRTNDFQYGVTGFTESRSNRVGESTTYIFLFFFFLFCWTSRVLVLTSADDSSMEIIEANFLDTAGLRFKLKDLWFEHIK